MDDKDVVRLEDRIEALGRESQLRLELAMSRIDAKFETIVQSLAALQNELTGQRVALNEQGVSFRAALDEQGVSLRAALDEQSISLRAALDEQRVSQRVALDEHRVSQRAALDELRGSVRGLYALVAGAWITIIVAVVGSALGATALWGGGFQAGQAERGLVAPQNAK